MSPLTKKAVGMFPAQAGVILSLLDNVVIAVNVPRTSGGDPFRGYELI